MRTNANLKRITGEHDARPSQKKMSQEQFVINLVTRIVGTKRGHGYVSSDDIASDVIMALLDAKGFSWPEDQIAEFCHKKANSMLKSIFFRREISECEMVVEGVGSAFEYFSNIGSYPAPQDIVCDAHRAYAQLKNIPNKQRQALEILCDGGNPIDVAEEMEISPYLAITLIKEGREYINRVDPFDE